MLRRGHVIFVLLISLLLYACGGGGGNDALTGSINPVPDTPREFSLTVLDESYIAGSSADITMDLLQGADEVTATIKVGDASDLRAAYVHLEYDDRFYSPVSIKADGLLGQDSELLSLAVTEHRGTVGYGEVLVRPDEATGFNGDGTLAVVTFSRSPFSELRSASTPPDDNSSATTLEFPVPETANWWYYSTGDYDQNGQTNIADLTPLGRHFGELGPFDESTVQGVIDYDNNDAINISDVTGIGIGFGSSVLEYRAYGSDNPEDYPAANGEAPRLDPLAGFPFANAIGDPSQDRLRFSETFGDPVPGFSYWVRPGDDSGDGTPSNLVGFDDIPDFELTFFQVDYTLDEDSQTDSEFGQVAIEFTGKADPEYFNLNVNGEWVIQNVPVLPVAGVGELQTVYMDFPLGNEPGTEVTEVDYGATLTSETVAEMPKQNHRLGVLTALVNIYNGQDAISALTSGEAVKEMGDEIDGDNWAAHSGAFPNQEAKKNECVPAAIANSLKFLKDKNPTEMGGVADADISSTSIGGAVGYTENGGTPGANGKATWPGKKDKHLKDKKVPVKTTSVPAEQSFTGEATAADCDKALQAIKDGKDVELQGRGHCAAIVGMAKLTNGKYVIYVAHDTNQGNEGGQQIQKIIYDPSAANPVAEGGWGFNGRNIFGFVIEEVTTKKDGEISLHQDNYSIDDFSLANSAHGLVEFTYEQTEDDFLYLNLSHSGEHQIQDLPLRSGEAGTTSTIYIPIEFLGEDGDDILSTPAGYSLDPAPTTLAPEENLLYEVADIEFNVDSGEDGAPLQYTGVTTDPIWFLGHNYTDAAFHPTSAITNQEAGKNECAPAAISNSLKLLQKLNPTQNQDLDVDIDDMKPTTGWGAGGAPVDGLNGEGSWWNRKKKWMNDRKEYPVQTDIVSDKSKFDDIIQAIKDGKDVELRVPGHVVMVTGIIKLANGQYILEIVHDSDQSDDTKGTQTELIKYDPTTNTFSGRGWINDKKFTDGDTLGCLFVVESFSNLNINRTNIAVDQTVILDSEYGEIDLEFVTADETQYFNLVLDDVWVVENLPVPSLGPAGEDEEVKVRFPFPGITAGDPLAEIPYAWEFGTAALAEPPTGTESSIIDPADFIVGSGEDGIPMLSSAVPSPTFNWLPFGITDVACHPKADVVNQEAGNNECAPAAISNSLKLLQNKYPVGMAGLDIDIDDMKPATGWSATGAPAGDPEDAGAWWNLKKDYMIENGYPVTTEIKTKADFGEIIDDIKAGKDVEMRVPGHVVMVTCVVTLANGDMIIWVAHDTDQADGTKGTTIEPIYYDSSEGTFHGNFWVEGKTAATPGNAGVLFVVEDYLDLSIPLPLCVDMNTIVPLGPPGIIPDGFTGNADLLYRPTGQRVGSITFQYAAPFPGSVGWQPGPAGTPLVIFDTIDVPAPTQLAFFGESLLLDIPGYTGGLFAAECLVRNSFFANPEQPVPAGQFLLTDPAFNVIDQFPYGPSSVGPTEPPVPFGKVLDPPIPPGFNILHSPEIISLSEMEGYYFDLLPVPVPPI